MIYNAMVHQIATTWANTWQKDDCKASTPFRSQKLDHLDGRLFRHCQLIKLKNSEEYWSIKSIPTNLTCSSMRPWCHFHSTFGIPVQTAQYNFSARTVLQVRILCTIYLNINVSGILVWHHPYYYQPSSRVIKVVHIKVNSKFRI